MVRELALQAEPVSVVAGAAGGQVWRLRVERETLRTPALSAKLAAVLEAATQAPATVETESGVAQDSIARREAAARALAQRSAEDTIRDDPAVQALLAAFAGARIVPGSIQPQQLQQPAADAA